MLVTHRMMGTFSKHIHAYIALCEFARQKYLEAGFQRERLELKPNFLTEDLGPGDGKGGYMMYLGRLVEDKGLNVLLDAWIKHSPNMSLRVVGRGPMAERVRQVAQQHSNVFFHDNEDMDGIMRFLGGANALILPSINYEGFPKVLVESFSRGTPVIASRLGAMAEVVVPGKSGMHFNPGDSEDLMKCVQQAIADPSLLTSMRGSTRRQFQELYTPEVNYDIFMGIYRRAIARRHRSAVADVEVDQRLAIGDAAAHE
jgi:glycosyltransferase involved in cell wall biosynthesis